MSDLPGLSDVVLIRFEKHLALRGLRSGGPTREPMLGQAERGPERQVSREGLSLSAIASP